MTLTAPPPPLPRLSLAITGHRETNAAFSDNRAGIEQVLAGVFEQCDTAAGAGVAPTRLHSMLIDGADQLAMALGKARGWELAAPLPFGRDLNIAINALPDTREDGAALLAGGDAADPSVQARAAAIRALHADARIFELAERDAAVSALLLAKLAAPTDLHAAQAFSFAASERAALAAQVMIEQADLLIAIWDGASTSFTGGTGSTVVQALQMGTPVLWIDARAPDRWRLLFSSEALAGIGAEEPPQAERATILASLVQGAIGGAEPGKAGAHGGFADGIAALDARQWRARSSRAWHGYRRIEALFGADSLKARFRDLRQTYEAPDAILTGSAAPLLVAAEALPGQDGPFMDRLKADVLRRFAWADGISTRISDTYRGGMVLNFLFSAFAIVGGIAYLPFASADEKWLFALFELGLLVGIMVITVTGQKRRWHGRWFETRRAAEYLRHAPILLALGVARPPARWPKGGQTAWPELFARHAIRGVGLPQVRVTSAYLRSGIAGLLLPYVADQRDYHRAKAARLARAHHNLDKLSEVLFLLAILSVSTYLALKFGGVLHLLAEPLAAKVSLFLTFLGVLLPTFGAGIAGIRYFGDFERFSAISEVTAEQLEAVAQRISTLLAAPEEATDYARAADLAHTADDIVVNEIESWQAVFAGKHITVPV